MADGLDIAVGPALRPLSAGASEPLEALALLNAEAETVIIDAAGGSTAEELPGAADARGCWGNRLAALVVNAVPPYRTGAMAESVSESWAEVDAVEVPESRVMLAPTVAQIAGHLEAVWTLEPVNADAWVERFLIGDNIMNNGPIYYGRYANQAVITRAQRRDIQLASMLPEARCLVLTGSGEPTEYIKAEAWERDIPLLQVFASTIETAGAFDLLFDS